MTQYHTRIMHAQYFMRAHSQQNADSQAHTIGFRAVALHARTPPRGSTSVKRTDVWWGGLWADLYYNLGHNAPSATRMGVGAWGGTPLLACVCMRLHSRIVKLWVSV